MSAADCIERIINTKLAGSNMKYCLMTADKLPKMIDGSVAFPNNDSCFVPLETLAECRNLNDYASVAVSVVASKISAIDIDHCLAVQYDFNSASDLAKEIVNMFKDWAYIESSFSGYGLRILFRQPTMQDYKSNYYIKNSKLGIEFYQHDLPARYVSVTGNVIFDNSIDCEDNHIDIIQSFADKYMKRDKPLIANASSDVDDTSIDDLMKKVRKMYRNDFMFQELWFKPAPGSNADESERDYKLVAMLYENVTKDKDKIMQIFMQSKFFKTKDTKHLNKWKNQNHRYFNYIYENVKGTH